MTTQIQIKRGTTTPTGLTVGEPAFDTATSRLFVGNTAAVRWMGGEITGGFDMGAGSAASQNRVPTQNAVYEYARRNFVASFNGATGAVTGASLGANTFTGLQTLTAGLTTSTLYVSSGSTLAGAAYFSALISSAAGFSGTGITLSGNLSAATKSFVIPHPTKKGMRLQYGSLEGPENGVYVRGRVDSDTIILPDYWKGLVHPESVTVNLTPIGSGDLHWVKSIKGNKVKIASASGTIHCFYTVYAERKDVPRLQVEG